VIKENKIKKLKSIKMGNQPSNGDKSNSNDNSQSKLNFDKNELKMLYRNFVRIDKDQSGNIEPNEFLNVPELADNPIVHRLITVFDKNNDGKISFYEFVNGLSVLTQAGTDYYF